MNPVTHTDAISALGVLKTLPRFLDHIGNHHLAAKVSGAVDELHGYLHPAPSSQLPPVRPGMELSPWFAFRNLPGWGTFPFEPLTLATFGGPAGPKRYGARPLTIFGHPPKKFIKDKVFTSETLVTESDTAYVNCTWDIKDGSLHCLKTAPGVKHTQLWGCTLRGGSSKCVIGESISLRYCYLDGAGQDGFFALGSDTEVACCTFGSGFGWQKGSHADGCQYVLGKRHMVYGNKYTMPHIGEENGGNNCNACVYVKNDLQHNNQIDKVLICDNLVDGGLYSIRINQDATTGTPAKDVTVIRNEFHRHYFAPFVSSASLSELNETVPLENDMSQAVRYRPYE